VKGVRIDSRILSPVCCSLGLAMSIINKRRIFSSSTRVSVVIPYSDPIPTECTGGHISRKKGDKRNGANTITETQTNVIEAAFQDFTERKDIAILLINQHVSGPSLSGDRSSGDIMPVASGRAEQT
jgi:hypothetical protein